MRPNFALSLSFSGIQLLQRQENGWGRVGDVDIGSADLTSDLAALRAKAEELGSGPVETKLIIPDDQIKYLTVDVSGLGKDALQSAVLAALDGATPYAVDELEFDFANETNSVHIAAVAKETLQEAEAFATEHGFSPMGFVAAPATSNFPKEATFGLSELAKARGLDALSTDGTLAIATGEAVAIKAPTPEPVEEPQVPTAPKTEPELASQEELSIPVPGFSSRRKDAAPVATPSAPVVSQEPEANASPRLDGAQRSVDPVVQPLAEVPAPSAVSPDLGQSPQITGVSDAAIEETAVTSKVGALRPGAAFDAGLLDDDVPAMPAGFAAAPRNPSAFQGAADGAPIANLRAPLVQDEAPETPDKTKESGSKTAAKALAMAGTAGTAALAGARGLMAKRAKQPATVVEPEIDPAVAAREDEKQRMTVFGARKPKKKKEPIAVGGKPRFLGLILTAILLLFLVSVAAWASVFLDEGLARFFGGADRNKAIAELQNPDAEISEEEFIELASLDTGETDLALQDEDPGQDGLTQVEPAPPLITPEEAEAKYAATGIWLASPAQPSLPPQISQDDIYSASIDARIIGQDAFALEPLAQARDQVPSGLGGPAAPAGSEFTFDEKGLVIATPDGALTPEGALVILGRPARVPPALPERLRTAALAPQETVTPQDSETGISTSLRPKTRPETLVEDTERTQLGGNSVAELAKIRPKLRPRVEKEIAEQEAAEVPATRLAVASSRKPSQRPRNFARIVSRAQKQTERQSDTQATQVASVAPRTVKPRIPSKASVAKTATVKNAINLSRVNLIGVYGKPSSRRALVRLSSGRYKKVKVGDRVDGGRVSAIGEGQLIYTKSGRNVTLRMPKG